MTSVLWSWQPSSKLSKPSWAPSLLRNQEPEQVDLLGTSARAADASCLNAPVTYDELHDCIKRQRKKSAGIGLLWEMIKAGGDLLHSCLVVILNMMLVSRFPSSRLLA